MYMKKIITCLLALLGMTSACGQKNYEDVDVAEFAQLTADSTVIVLDVRTADEYSDGHIKSAVNIDVKEPDFLEKAKAQLPSGRVIAVYCRSGRRSANACSQLGAEGYKTVNLKGNHSLDRRQEACREITPDRLPIVTAPGNNRARLLGRLPGW